MKGKIFSRFLCITVAMILLSGGFFGAYISKVQKAKAAGNTFWVDGSVGVSGDGTELSPWKTIIEAEANAGVTNGDTIHVETGIYVEASTIGGTGNINFAKGITWIADGGDVTIQATSGGASENQSAAQVSSGNTASFTHFVFDALNTNTLGNALNLNGASNKTFTNCTFQYGGYRGVFFVQNGGSNNLVTSSTFINNSLASSRPLIYFYYNSTGSVNFVNNTYNAYGNTFNKGFIDTHAGSTASAMFSGGTYNYSGVAAGMILINWAARVLTIDSGDFTNVTGSINYFMYISQGSTPPTTGKITFTNNNFQSDVIFAGSSLIYASKRADTIWVNNNTFNMTNTAATTSGLILIRDNLSVQVEDNDVTIESVAMSGIVVSSTQLTSMQGATISGNTIRTKSKSGFGMAIGRDDAETATTSGMLNGAVIENNFLYGPVYYDPDITGVTLHGYFISCNKGIVRNNYANGSNYGLIVKGQEYDWANDLGYGVYSNVLINSIQNGIYLKGVKNVPVFNNTLYLASNPDFDMSHWAGMIYVARNCVDEPCTSWYISQGAAIYNNILVARSGINMVSIDSYSKADSNLNNNIYWVNSGATPQFSWSGSVKSGATALNDWQTAIHNDYPLEPNYDQNSDFADPMLVDTSSYDVYGTATNNYEIKTASPATYNGISVIPGTGGGSAINVTTLNDYAGVQFVTPNPSIGALEAETTAPVVFGVTDGQITKTPLVVTFDNGTATLNGASFSSGTTVSADGIYQLVVTDTYGNATTVNFIIDNDTPNINISDPAHILVSTTASTYTIRGTMEDLLSGLASVDINGVGLSIASTDFTVNVNLVMGLNTFLITATDNAGNTGITPVYLTRTAVPIPTILPDRNSTIRRVFSPLAEVSTDQTVNSLEAANDDDSLIYASDLTIFNGTEYETLVNGDATTYTELPIFRGKTTPNSKVFLQINGNEIINAETTSDSNGNWSYQVQQALSKGAHTLSITVKDQLDNILSTKLYNFTVVEKTDDQTANSSVWIYYAIGVFVLGFLLFLRIKPKNKQVSH